MKLKKYSKYKDSGIDWIGEIPEDWEIKKMNGNIKFDIGFTPSTGKEEFYDGDEVWVTIGDMKKNIVIDSKSYLSDLGVKGHKKVKKGSLLYSFKLSVGKVAFAGRDLYTNEAIASFTSSNKYDLKYLYYHFPDSLVNFGTENIYGAKMLNQDLIKSSKILFPPLNIQNKISSFLDSKTSQIEKLIKKDKNLIELLKERRVSLINKAVTKGLDDNVKMKDSGVEWIGEIPENSDLVIFRRICNVNQGYQIAQELRLEEEENKSKIYLTIRYLNSKGEGIKEYILNPPKSVCCKKEDVLMARTGSTGQIISGVEGVFHNNFFKINYNKKKVNNKYLVYYLEQKLIKNILLLKAGVTTIPDLNHDSFLETPFILHSYEKQEKIVIFLDKKTKNIDNHIKKVEKRIRLYEEYKKSLIYNVVTGKVEV